MNSHLLLLFISYRSSGEKLIKYQANSSRVIMSVILMTTLFYKALILQEEIRCWSLWGLKGLMANWFAPAQLGYSVPVVFISISLYLFSSIFVGYNINYWVTSNCATPTSQCQSVFFSFFILTKENNIYSRQLTSLQEKQSCTSSTSTSRGVRPDDL